MLSIYQDHRDLERHENPQRFQNTRRRPTLARVTSTALGLAQQLIQQLEAEVDFLAADVQRRRECDHVLVVATDIEDQADLLAVVLKLGTEAHVHHAIEQLAIRRKAVRFADLGAQGEAEAIDITDFLVTLLQVFQPILR